MNQWIDVTVIDCIDYFNGVMARGYKWAAEIALFFGILGVIWTGIKIAISKQQIKQGLWDLLWRWMIFIVVMTIYPNLVTGLSYIGTAMGVKAGAGYENVERNLRTLYKEINKSINVESQHAAAYVDELKNNYDLEVTTSFSDCKDYDDFINKVSKEIKTNEKFKNNRKEINAMAERYKNYSGLSLFDKTTAKLLEDVLIMPTTTGKNGENIVNVNMLDSYLGMNIWLVDEKGNNLSFLSPAALLKVALLECNIMWQKTKYDFVSTGPEGEEIMVVENDHKSMKEILWALPQWILTAFCCVVIVLAVTFAVIQYTMSIVEYAAVSGIAALFLPLLLFEGTKDIPKKFVAVFTSFFIKLIVITICMFFSFNLIVVSTMETISDYTGMNWVTFAGVLFNSVLTFVLTSNAPKIAQTILTGQPQLSMGEFVAGLTTAGMVAGAQAHVLNKGVKDTYKAGNATGKAIHKASGAAEAASNLSSSMTIANGGSDKLAKANGIKAGFSAFGKSVASDVGGGIKSSLKNAGSGIVDRLNSPTGTGPISKAVSKFTGGAINFGEKKEMKRQDYLRNTVSGLNEKNKASLQDQYGNKKLQGNLQGMNIASSQKNEDKINKSIEKEKEKQQAKNINQNLTGHER